MRTHLNILIMKTFVALFVSILGLQTILAENQLISLISLQQAESNALELSLLQDVVNSDEVAWAAPQVIDSLIKSAESSATTQAPILASIQSIINKDLYNLGLGTTLAATSAPAASTTSSSGSASPQSATSASPSGSSASPSGSSASPSGSSASPSGSSASPSGSSASPSGSSASPSGSSASPSGSSASPSGSSASPSSSSAKPSGSSAAPSGSSAAPSGSSTPKPKV